MSVKILVGDCRDQMKAMQPESVNCVVTSPPYFGLRDYGMDGQIGLEASPEEFIASMVSVFQDVRRVLRNDGTLWLNLGDTYSRNPAKGGSGTQGKNEKYLGDNYREAILKGRGQGSSDGEVRRSERAPFRFGGLADKQMIAIPWRVALALQADGWYLRQDIVWAKPNPMPESVRDRCTKSHEYIFLMSKTPRYFYDADAIKEKSNEDEPRNKRDVWTVPTQAYSEAHFATFPPDLIEPCILAGCPKGGTVLDPFGGAGTTGLVADRHGRNAILLELNPKYAAMAKDRIKQDHGMFGEVE